MKIDLHLARFFGGSEPTEVDPQTWVCSLYSYFFLYILLSFLLFFRHDCVNLLGVAHLENPAIANSV